jgi:hypothetical protein
LLFNYKYFSSNKIYKYSYDINEDKKMLKMINFIKHIRQFLRFLWYFNYILRKLLTAKWLYELKYFIKIKRCLFIQRFILKTIKRVKITSSFHIPFLIKLYIFLTTYINRYRSVTLLSKLLYTLIFFPI